MEAAKVPETGRKRGTGVLHYCVACESHRSLMPSQPLDLTLELLPKARFDVVEFRSHFAAEHRAFAAYPHCLYWSSHTTAGFLDRSLTARLSPEHIPSYVEAFRALFPEGAGYEHDRLERRDDLDPEQRAVEPRNADSHLAFIAGGLRPCVTHPNRPGESVFFVDLDGVVEGRPRRRLTRLIGFQQRARRPDHAHRGARLGAPDRLDQPEGSAPRALFEPLGIRRPAPASARAGCGSCSTPSERHSALTINEYETLLMKYDLAEVLRNPLRFFAEKSRHALANPRARARQDARLREIRLRPRPQQEPRYAGAAWIDRRESARPHACRARRALLPHAALGQPARLRTRQTARTA